MTDRPTMQPPLEEAPTPTALLEDVAGRSGPLDKSQALRMADGTTANMTTEVLARELAGRHQIEELALGIDDNLDPGKRHSSILSEAHRAGIDPLARGRYFQQALPEMSGDRTLPNSMLGDLLEGHGLSHEHLPTQSLASLAPLNADEARAIFGRSNDILAKAGVEPIERDLWSLSNLLKTELGVSLEKGVMQATKDGYKLAEPGHMPGRAVAGAAIGALLIGGVTTALSKYGFPKLEVDSNKTY